MSRNSIFRGYIYHIKLKFAEGGGVENNNLRGEKYINGFTILITKLFYYSLCMSFKAQYWPLCFARLCYCFGFPTSEVSIARVLFWLKAKASEFWTSQKWLPGECSRQCIMGNTGSLSPQCYQQLSSRFKHKSQQILRQTALFNIHKVFMLQ